MTDCPFPEPVTPLIRSVVEGHLRRTHVSQTPWNLPIAEMWSVFHGGASTRSLIGSGRGVCWTLAKMTSGAGRLRARCSGVRAAVGVTAGDLVELPKLYNNLRMLRIES